MNEVENAEGKEMIIAGERAWFEAQWTGDMQDAIRRVRKLHKPFGDKNQWCNHCEIGQNSGYEWADYPCDTIKALDGIANEA